MFKKGITGKDSEMMTGKHLGPEPKKKKKIEANQVCSSEETPLAPVGGSTGIAWCSSAKREILCRHQGTGPETTRGSRGRNHGMPGYTVMSYFKKTKQ